MAKKQLTDDELSAILAKAISNSEHMTDGKLQKERDLVDRYYRGEEPVPMHKGDSKYVSRDVFDAVDSMRATVLEAFTAHSRIVFFKPENGESVDDAKQATDYTRHVFFKENPGEDIMYDALSDGLTKRMAVAKVYHEETSEDIEYTFEGLTMPELTIVLDDYEEWEFVETETSAVGLLSGTFNVTDRKSGVVVELIQPEDFLVVGRSSCLKDSDAAIHRVEKTKSDLLKEGYDKKKVNQIVFRSGSDMDFDFTKMQRFEMTDDITTQANDWDGSRGTVTLYEVYIHLDMNKDGKSELWKVCYTDQVILSKEQVSRMPFVAFVPLPIAHTFLGDNFAESVIPYQNARTVLIRQIINHSLTTNQPRQMVLNGTIQNPNELLDNRHGGIVNVRRMDGIAPIPQAPLNPFVFNLIETLDGDKEETTGISRLSQGLNKDAISTQNAEGMVEQLISHSQQRQKIVAKQFGKFLRELWHMIYCVAIDYVDSAEYMEVTGDYIEVDPSMWKERKLASVELSLGYGEQQQEAMKWTEVDQYFMNDPQLSAAYTPEKRWEVLERMAEKRGIEDLEAILTHPSKIEPQGPSEIEILQMEEKKATIALQQAQAQTMLAKAETDRMTAQAALIKAQAEAAERGKTSELDTEKFAHEVYMDREELELARNTPTEQQKATYHPD